MNATVLANGVKQTMSQHSKLPAQKDPTFSAKSRSTWIILRRVYPYLKPYKLMALGTVGCAVLSLLFSLAYVITLSFTIAKGFIRASITLPRLRFILLLKCLFMSTKSYLFFKVRGLDIGANYSLS